MSVNDFATLGHTISFAPTLDNPKAAKYHPTHLATEGKSGNGLVNNRVFATTSDNQTAFGLHHIGIGNAAAQCKVGRNIDATKTGGSNIVGATGLLVVAQFNAEFRPYSTVNGNFMIWYDYAEIKINHLFESLNKNGLVRRFDATLRLWVNSGTAHITVGQPNTTDRIIV
jgi:hypothetical protein